MSVGNAQVTFRWLGDYAHIESQVGPVNRFIADFALLERRADVRR